MYVFAIFLMTTCFTTGFGLRCYECSTYHEGDRCFKEGMNEIECKNAVKDVPICATTITREGENRVSGVERTCNLRQQLKHECDDLNNDDDGDKMVDCYECATDLCNHGDFSIGSSIGSSVSRPTLSIHVLLIPFSIICRSLFL